MVPAYQYNVGDIIETYDKSFGIIVSRTNAHDFMAFNKNIKDRVIRSYMHIAVYKALINGNITYVNESNIKGIVEWKRKEK